MNLAEMREYIRSAFEVAGNQNGWKIELLPYKDGFLIAEVNVTKEDYVFHACVYARDLVHNGIIVKGIFKYQELVKFVDTRYILINDCFRIRKGRE